MPDQAQVLADIDSQVKRLPIFVKELLAGGVAGGLSKTAVAPLERVKILLQTGRAPSSSIFGTLLSVHGSEGVQGFFRGNAASVYRIVPYAAFNFYAYERYRAALCVLLDGRVLGLQGRAHVPAWIDLLAGASAGATAVLVTYPLDLVRTRLAWTTETRDPVLHRRHSVVSMLQLIHRQEGVKGVFRGLSPTLLGVMPYAGLKFYTYQSLKGAYQKWNTLRHPDAAPSKPPLYLSLLFGGTAGLLAQTATYPLDVVRRRMQVESAEHHDVRTSTWSNLRMVVKQQGVRGLFQGLTINYLKVVPQTAIGFSVYDAAKSFLGLKNHL